MEEKKKFTLIPVYDLKAVFNTWPMYVQGIEAVVRHAGPDMSIDKVYNGIMAKELLLWVGFLNGVYCGFVTTRLENILGKKKFLWICHLFKKVKVPSEFVFEGFKIIRQYGIDNGYEFMKFWVQPKFWQETLIAAGFTPGYLEFIQELKDENSDQGGNPNIGQ